MNYCSECGKPTKEMCNHCIKMQVGENHAAIYRINSHIKELQGKCSHQYKQEGHGSTDYGPIGSVSYWENYICEFCGLLDQRIKYYK